MEYLPSWEDGLYLSHHGILGQKWGVRRYQNEDGSLTAAGRKRQARSEYRENRSKAVDKFNKLRAKDDVKVYSDYRLKGMAYSEADRRAYNQRSLRNKQYKEHQLAYKADMSKKLAENSSGMLKDFHNFRANMQKNASERYKQSAKDTKHMIKETNRIHDSLSKGERAVANLLSSDNDSLNQYYMDRRTRSRGSVIGERVAREIINDAAYITFKAAQTRRQQSNDDDDE